jgi:hypothetical protein
MCAFEPTSIFGREKCRSHNYILDVLTLLSNFALENVIRKVQEKQVGLKLNGTHQLLVYADDVNRLGDNIDAMKKNMATLKDASEEVGLEVNTDKTKYAVSLPECRAKS